MKEKLKRAYMKTAETFAELSHARRLHVGAIIVKNDRIISIGYNGTPAGWDNNCEDVEWISGDAGAYLSPEEILEGWPYEGEHIDADGNKKQRRYRLKTKPEVLHAERNALDKLGRCNESGLGSTMFVTHAPCLECAKSMYGVGIAQVFWRHNYRDEAGLTFLRQVGIILNKVEE